MALCDRNCNVIAPFVTAPGNRNETILLAPAMSSLKRIVKLVGLDLKGSVMSLDGVYNSPYAKTLFLRKFTSSFIDAILAATSNLYLIAK